ncbi:hypothetical protein ABW20_dc0102897 [Dactylellina cionopaga]|nr:hypothetical protein ABW20_dc0102897 [Dactylellina cionopaga]
MQSQLFKTHLESPSSIRGGSNEFVARYHQFLLGNKKYNTAPIGVDPEVVQFSGYIDDNANDKHFFYWFFESRSEPKDDPVILWLNGGPGCSGLMGVFMQGPSNIKNDQLVLNPFSWNNNASIIFLDQPVNTGFSHSQHRISSTDDAAKDGYKFLTLFFQKYPQYAKQDFHIAGESYGGRFAPAFAREILNRQSQSQGQNINLKSVLMGSSHLDARNMFPYQQKLACGEGGYPAILNHTVCKTMEADLPQCLALIDACYISPDNTSCGAARDFCNPKIMRPFNTANPKHSQYDIRKICGTPGAICRLEDLQLDGFLNQTNFLSAVGSEGANYKYVDIDVIGEFRKAGDDFKPHHRYIADVLQKVPVFVYSGDADFNCPRAANQDTLEALEWSGKSAYNSAQWQSFQLNGRMLGQSKSANGLKFMRIYDSGHEVGWHQPEALANMLTGWLEYVRSLATPPTAANTYINNNDYELLEQAEQLGLPHARK